MDKLILELLASGAPHLILVAGIVFLYMEYRELKAENKSLHEKLEVVRQVSASTHALTLKQNEVLADIQSAQNSTGATSS